MNQQVGRYKITGVIGRGGMASVYKAYDDRFAREVAIKMLHQHGLEDDTTRSKFAQEARIIAALEHHAIVPVYDYGEHDGQPYLVMRLMLGGSLKERLALGATGVEETAVILTRICAALDKAHGHHIVHRDIKPANILFDEDGIAYLADFGIARLTDHTQTTTVIGSPRYMAPEQAQARPLSPQTDVYQMGVVLFQMLTGRVPFDGETTEGILYQHIHSHVPLALELNPALPPRCDGVLGYALAKKPEERYATAGELARAFTQAVGLTGITITPSQPNHGRPTPHPEAYPDTIVTASVPVAAPPAPAHTPAPAPAPAPTRSLWGWMAGVGITAVLLLLCGGAMLAWANGDWLLGMLAPTFEPGVTLPAQTEPTTAASNEEAGIEPPPSTPTPNEGQTEGEPTAEIIFAPTATLETGPAPAPGETIFSLTAAELAELGGGVGQIAYAANRDGQFDIYTNNADGSERRLTSFAKDDFRPIWSPDGTRIAYHSLRDVWQVYVMNADGSGQLNLTRTLTDESFPQWSPDGSQLVFHSNRDNSVKVQFDIFVMNADGSNVRQLTTSEDNETGASWSPDGTQIAYQRKIGNREYIFLMNADGSNQRQLTSGSHDSLYPIWSPDGRRLLFHSNRAGGWHIFSMAIDGSDIRQISGGDTEHFFATWSPNGQWVIYHTNVGDGNRDLFITRADGTETIRLTTTEQEERMPSWK